MKRRIKITLAVLVVLLITIQFIPRDHNQSAAAPANDITRVYVVPANVQAIFKNSCYDCHSNNTSYPWYAHIQPLRLMLDKHVIQGKEDLNFNDYGTYSERKKRHKLEAIANSMTENTMPLPSYLFIHHKAALTPGDKAVILNWVKNIDRADNE